MPPLRSLAYRSVVDGLPFVLGVEAVPGDERLFVVAKDGRIFVILPDGTLGPPFLDLRDRVRNTGEQGLLGLAFHPEFASNGRFFVHYSDLAGDTRVVEYRVTSDPNRADAATAREILFVRQPASNHNGGQLSFGPDGYLYLGLGDGGGADDRFGNGQRLDTLLGKILRLDVDGEPPYEIPSDNPLAAGTAGREVWAYGLRNPWRFSFDDGSIYIADVGQRSYEEINVTPWGEGGLNFGWPITEGLHCFRPSSECDTTGLTLPVVEVSHSDSGSCSVTGGFVYRGSAIPELTGHYLYSDYCGGWLRSFRYVGGSVVDETDWTEQVGPVPGVASFGRDEAGEVYLALRSGQVLALSAER